MKQLFVFNVFTKEQIISLDQGKKQDFWTTVEANQETPTKMKKILFQILLKPIVFRH